MIEKVKGAGGVVFEFECEVCGGRWERVFMGWWEVGEYVRLHEVCPVGWHVVEGGLGRVVWVRKVGKVRKVRGQRENE
jgi:hypothetical protein